MLILLAQDSEKTPELKIMRFKMKAGAVPHLQKSSAKPKGLFRHFVRQESADLKSKLTFYLPNITKVESSSSQIKIVNYAVHFLSMTTRL